MKKLCVMILLFVSCAVAAAVWFSPLATLDGEAYAYSNNVPVSRIDGLCYGADELVRVDFDGDERDMYCALDRISAREVKTVRTEGSVLVYAYSPRVCCMTLHTSDGSRYNVMAAVTNGRVCIGTPVLPGCY